MLRLLNSRRDSPELYHGDACDFMQSRTMGEVKPRLSVKPRPLPQPEKMPRTVITTTTKQSTVSSTPMNSPHAGWNTPHLTKTPWELERYKKNSAWRRSKAPVQFLARFFEALPKEVYNCVLIQLEQTHLSTDQACSPCYLKDLHSLSLTSRAWDKAVTAQMYRKVLVLANEEHAKLPKLKISGTGRLKLLRRTLRDRPSLARRVRELHLSDFQALYQNASIEREEIVNLVASLVMVCPYLERLVGFNVPYQHSFDRLSHALSTRPNLKDRIWLLKEEDSEPSDEDEELGGYYLAACDPTERFLELNSRHPLLSTLVLHQNEYNTSTSLKFRAIIGTLRNFPVLRHLAISGLPASSFTNMVLNALPSNLKSLRLENLPGLNDKGVQRFATSQLISSIEKLSLVNIELTSLLTVSKIFCTNWKSLRHFSLVQGNAPSLPGGISLPNFRSPCLSYLHWEIRSEAGPSAVHPSHLILERSDSPSFPFTDSEPFCCLATSLLAASISDGAFPSLRRIRVPHDPQGVLQAICKPLATAVLPSDTSLFALSSQAANANGFSITLDDQTPLSYKIHNFSAMAISSNPRADSAIGTPTLTGSFTQSDLSPVRSRLAAQSRILAARKESVMTIRVVDPDGEMQLSRDIGGYIGHVASRITYDLHVDKGRRPESNSDKSATRSEWITGIEDLAGELDLEGLHERSWWGCGHVIKGEGRSAVRAEELF